MKKSPFKFLLIIPAVVLTSCGYGLKEIYNGVPYVSSDFFKNYYCEWDNRINPNKPNENKITKMVDERELTTADSVFTSYNDATFSFNEPDADKYVYYYDKQEQVPESDKRLPYGPAVKLSNYDDSFRYGVVGKLFDGQMFCNGEQAFSRVQVKEGRGNGFGALFSKESDNAKYMMLNFKCSLVTKENQNLSPNHKSDVRLILSFIYKNDTGYTYVPVSYVINDAPTNSGETTGSGRESKYVCFGFSMENIGNKRLIGFTFNYEKLADDYTDVTDEKYHAIMLYEVSFPHTTWH